MTQSPLRIEDNEFAIPGVKRRRRDSLLKFVLRYPIFLLAFGPPILRSSAVDATKGMIDVWSLLQLGLLFPVAIRAMYRLASAEFFPIPKKVRSILRLCFLLGMVFLASAVYSPSRFVSVAYSGFYFLTLICVVEFVVDVYKDPPDWLQCVFNLRHISLLLLAAVLLVLPFRPGIVLTPVERAGIRFLGGSVAPVPLIGPMIAIISAYNFLHRIESKGRSAFFFLVGLIATLITQARGAELALLVALVVLGAGWARTGRRFTYFFLFSFMAFILFLGGAAGVIGGDRIWSVFNRGQSAEGIASASGRTDYWKYVINYCMVHPQGMGYVAGFRTIFKEESGVLNADHIGNAHNTYMQALADAGWLALVIYLALLIKIILLGWRFAKTNLLLNAASNSRSYHAIRCTLVLLVFCLAEGMDGADFSVPLRVAFYWQNILIAMILGMSTSLIVASRVRHNVLAE